jgi:hypothetical protein
MTKKYGVLVSFCSKLAIFGKTIYLRILSETLKFFRTRKKSYTGLLWITDVQFGCLDQKIWCFGQFFSPELAIFGKTVG